MIVNSYVSDKTVKPTIGVNLSNNFMLVLNMTYGEQKKLWAVESQMIVKKN